MRVRKSSHKLTSGKKAHAVQSTNGWESEKGKRRTYVAQSDVPSFSVMQALRVPRAIGEHFAYRPTTPLNVAAALNMQPNSSQFRQLCGASMAYGLTKGGYNAAEISIEPLGLRIVRPTEEGEDAQSMREALLKPRTVGEFLRRYNNAPLPRTDIAANVLVDMGVPPDRASDILNLILDGARSVGLIRTIKGKEYVDLTSSSVPDDSDVADGATDTVGEEQSAQQEQHEDDGFGSPPLRPSGGEPPVDQTIRRVFIAHGKNRTFVDPIKKLLGFGELEPVVSVERVSVSQPVPDKVISEMRSCGAAIIHVEAEQTITGDEVVLSPNVSIEIGAAMALYGRRFILLVKDGVKLPSNLQGLFEVRYTGDTLDGEATIKLLEAINDIKNHPLPERYTSGITK